MSSYIPSRPGGASPGPHALEYLVAELHALRQHYLGLTRTPQLTSSSIDDGSLALVTGGDVAGYVGTQYDGTTGSVTVAGPTPPIPSAPTLETVLGGVRVRWDGTFEDPQTGFTSPVVAPLDWKAVEVHISTSPSFETTGFGTMRGAITSARGGDFTDSSFPPGTLVYARLVSRSTAGKFSDPSLTAGPVATGQVTLADLGFDIASYTGGTTIYYGTELPVEPEGGFTEGDLWLRTTGTNDVGDPQYQTWRWNGAAWAMLEAQGISDALARAIAAQQAVLSKATVYYQSSAPSWTGPYGSAVWFDTDNGNRQYVWSGTTWTDLALGTGAIKPNSLIASDVIATGSIVASLLEAVLVLANRIIVGELQGKHAELTPTGMHVYNDNADEVARVGTTTNDYFGIADAEGSVVASIDDTGSAHFTSATVTGSLLVGGQDITDILSDQGTLVAYYERNVSTNHFGPIRDRIGLIEVNGYLYAGRRYALDWHLFWWATVADCECRITMTYTPPYFAGSNTADDPMIWSTTVNQIFDTVPVSYRWKDKTGTFYYSPTMTGRHRFLLCLERGVWSSGDPDVYNVGYVPTNVTIRDMGPDVLIAGSVSYGGGSLYQGPPPPPPPPPVQNYYVELGPSAYYSIRGNGTTRTDTTDVVQGWDPSGYNGDGFGWWYFALPSITGTVDRVDWYVYTNHTYYNSGGTAIWNIASEPTGVYGDDAGPKMRTDWYVGGYPKPGGITVTLPADWWPQFKDTPPSGQRAVSITAGDTNTTDETYYCRFDGPSARLRIWFTQ